MQRKPNFFISSTILDVAYLFKWVLVICYGFLLEFPQLLLRFELYPPTKTHMLKFYSLLPQNMILFRNRIIVYVIS